MPLAAPRSRSTLRRIAGCCARGFDREVEIVAIDRGEARGRRNVEALVRHLELGHRRGAARIDRAALGEVHVAAELALGEEPGAARAVLGELRIVGIAAPWRAAAARSRRCEFSSRPATMVGASAPDPRHAADRLEADLRIGLFERAQLEAEIVERELGGLIRAQLAAHRAFDLFADRRLVQRTQRGLFDRRGFGAGRRHLDRHLARGLAAAVASRAAQAFAGGIRIAQRAAEIEIDRIGVAAAGDIEARADVERIEVDAGRSRRHRDSGRRRPRRRRARHRRTSDLRGRSACP